MLSASKEEQSAAPLAVHVVVARRPMLKNFFRNMVSVSLPGWYTWGQDIPTFIPERQLEKPRNLDAIAPAPSYITHQRRSGVRNMGRAQSQVDMVKTNWLCVPKSGSPLFYEVGKRCNRAKREMLEVSN